MVTGANAGVGKATALGLAKLGATVVMVCRNAAKAHAALAEIQTASGNPAISLMLADLSIQSDIHKLVADFKDTHKPLHILVNNAGVTVKHRTLTPEGVELSFAVNHLAPFLLTNLLLDVLKTNAPARIINVTSAAEAMGEIDFDDLTLENKYTAMRGYAQSKLANVFFTYELARRLNGTGVIANCVNPGAVKTKVAQGMGGWYGLMARLARPFAKTPEQAAEDILYLAGASEMQGVNGKYFEGKKETPSSPFSYDAEVARHLWTVSEELTGVA